MFEFLKPVFRNLFTKPSTRLYPIAKREPFANARGHVEGINEDCVFCGICAKKCPADAITVDRSTKTWKLDQFKCVICNVCAESCPKKCISMDNVHRTAEYKKSYVKIQGKADEAKPAGKPIGAGESCVFCGICAKKCPEGAITVDRPNKSWTIDSEKCVGCGVCISSCPKKCIKTE